MLIVALGHAGVPGMAGGYVGVDVFFVISGFLITGWLLDRSLDSARVPFADFYAARARRILPASGLALVLVCAASAVYLNAVRAVSAVHDALWAAFFAANIHFTHVGADYFARDNPPSPIQHFWTLAVEEQFYLGWPALLALLLAVLRFGRRGRPVSRACLAGFVAIAVAASLIWSIHLTAANPNAAYFSTTARAWELGIGALIAVCLPWIPRIAERRRAALTWAGLAGIVAATVAFGPETPFPDTAALLPVAGAGLVVAGGVGAVRGGAGVILGRQPLPLIGDLSYAFYLWHWPALVIPAQYLGHPLSVPQNLLLLAIALAFSYFTYRVYENPLRHAGRLRRPQRALALWPVSVSAVAVAAAVAIAAIATPHSAAPSLAVRSGGSRPVAAAPLAPQERVRAALLASLTPARLRQEVPDALAPPVGRLLNDRFRVHNCTVGGRSCELGDRSARRRLVVLGDSHGEMWLGPLVRFAVRYHWRLVPLIQDGCVPSVLPGDCADWYRRALDHVRRLHPDVVVVSQFWSSWGPDGVAAVARELRELAPLAHRLVLVEDPPARDRTAIDCLLARGATLGSCTFRVTPREAASYVAARREARKSGAAYVRTLQWFCVRGRCPTVVGTVVTYRDTTHITSTYASLLAEPFAEAIAVATGS